MNRINPKDTESIFVEEEFKFMYKNFYVHKDANEGYYYTFSRDRIWRLASPTIIGIKDMINRHIDYERVEAIVNMFKR